MDTASAPRYAAMGKTPADRIENIFNNLPKPLEWRRFPLTFFPFISNMIPTNNYLVSERKLGFFVQIKPPAWRAYAPEGKTKILTAGIH